MSNFVIEPKVDGPREFLEIANDFANPLELVREAISNSFDANANFMRFKFYVEKEYGEDVFIIFIEDDGHGMDKKEMQAFFDLGNSTTREDPESIGEKGHGTKVYFNSKEIEVETSKGENHLIYKATMKDPIRNLHDDKIPEVQVDEKDNSGNWKGTKIWVKGYNNNRRDKFTHERLKDYILWSTKFGSPEKEFGISKNEDKKLFLKGVDKSEEEELSFGHMFPEENKNVEKLFDEKGMSAPKYYVRKWKKEGYLPNFPDKKYQAIFYVEGDAIKRESNPMLRRQGYVAPEGAYAVAERYGLWVCKDYIPIQRKIEWIVTKGTEYVRFHAFFNFQGFRLTANRASVENTPSEIMKDIETEVRKIYNEITDSDDWDSLEWLEQEASGELTKEKEKKDYEKRIKRSQKVKVAEYQGHTLIEPIKENKYPSEQGVYSLFLILKVLKPDLFPFEIVDYDTHFGIDVIAREPSGLSIDKSHLHYVEFKGKLTSPLNHSFEYLKSIVCWDTDILDGGAIVDVSRKERTMKIISASDPNNKDKYTKYFLDDPASYKKIEVFVLKDYLKEKIGIEFRPRTVATSSSSG
ncbi:MAG: ATP-binding protein [bacterium]|nr:ATP-binding protein [bacterium]